MKIEITGQNKWHQSITIKLAVLAFMGILLLIPLQLIKEGINERQANGEKVIKEISEQWAARQYLSGPVLNIPLRSIPATKDEKPVPGTWHILPERLDITGNIDPEIRYRGIYKAAVYNSQVEMTGELLIPQAETLKGWEIMWNEAYLTTGITDNRGVKGTISFKWGENDLEAEPGVRDYDLFRTGVTFSCPPVTPGARIAFSARMNLAGSGGLLLTPLGKTTTAALKSSWSSPSFTGSFLPVTRDISDKGFTGKWEVTHLNRSFPQNWTGSAFSPLESSFGVDLFQPVDHYQKSWRSARYGILFIALTFLALIFLELTGLENIHIFNYFLVAIGLVLFFSLLNSLSEQTGFNIAYLIASLATITMISLFTRTLFTNRKRGLMIAGLLVLLYGFIFILLSLNDFAYLAGNIGLFILLAVVMALSSRMKAFRNNDQAPAE